MSDSVTPPPAAAAPPPPAPPPTFLTEATLRKKYLLIPRRWVLPFVLGLGVVTYLTGVKIDEWARDAAKKYVESEAGVAALKRLEELATQGQGLLEHARGDAAELARLRTQWASAELPARFARMEASLKDQDRAIDRLGQRVAVQAADLATDCEMLYIVMARLSRENPARDPSDWASQMAAMSNAQPGRRLRRDALQKMYPPAAVVPQDR